MQEHLIASAVASAPERGPVKWQVIPLAACALLTSVYALTWILTRYAEWDDEGFMLFTLRQWMSGTSLYDVGYTEYGPFYYLAYSTWFRLSGLAPDHDGLRAITVALWVVMSLGCASCVWAFHRSVAWTVATMFSIAVVLRALTGEPGHPQGLVWALLIAVPVLMLTCGRVPAAALFVTLGAIVAMITLVKINVGVFLLLSLLVVLGPQPLPLRLRAAGRRVLVTLAVAMPVVLMNQHLTSWSMWCQCALAAFSLGTVTHTLLGKSTDPPNGAVGWLAAGVVGTTALLLALALRQGESAYGLLNGILLQPLRFSRAIQPQALDATSLIAATALAALSGLLMVRSPAWNSSSVLRHLRTALATLMALLAVLNPAFTAVAAPVVLWTLVPDGHDGTSPVRLAARTIVALAAFGSLVAFPVPGTQASLASTLILWAAIIGVLDDATVDRRWRHAISLAVLATVMSLRLVQDGFAYASVERVPTELPGSRLVRLDPEGAATFTEIVRLSEERCQTLVTLPGMNSFNIWTGLPRPNEFAVSAAMVLFDGPAQRQLVQDFETSPRPCVIDSPTVEQWSSAFRKPRTDQPFVDFVRRDLVRVYSRSGYDIRVPPRDVSLWRHPR